MGYSMGARIAGLFHAGRGQPRALAGPGGLGAHLVEGVGLPLGIAEAMEAPSLESLTDPMQRLFRAFADQNHSDRRALAACIRGSRQTLEEAEVCGSTVPSWSRSARATKSPATRTDWPRCSRDGEALEIPGRDHNLAVGDKVYKAGVLRFLERRDEAAQRDL